MLIGLVKDLLGPRNGPFEVLSENQDPRNEYITGVLAPEQIQFDRTEVDADIDEVGEEVSDEESPGITEGIVIAPPSAFSPALNPKVQPRSIGLTFVLQPEQAASIPVIDICVTWARYEKQGKEWRRRPHAHIVRAISTDSEQRCWNVGPDVELQMRVHHVLKDDTY